MHCHLIPWASSFSIADYNTIRWPWMMNIICIFAWQPHNVGLHCLCSLACLFRQLQVIIGYVVLTDSDGSASLWRGDLHVVHDYIQVSPTPHCVQFLHSLLWISYHGFQQTVETIKFHIIPNNYNVYSNLFYNYPVHSRFFFLWQFLLGNNSLDINSSNY